jgi:hypothetical protein
LEKKGPLKRQYQGSHVGCVVIEVKKEEKAESPGKVVR